MRRTWNSQLLICEIFLEPGEVYVTRNDEVISTVLGSCSAACVRHRAHPIGGINHFILPRPPVNHVDQPTSSCYGINALERLVDAVLVAGGHVDELEVKVFGGASVIDGGSDVGRRNIDFVRRFFATKRVSIASQDLGGRVVRRLHYWPRDGRDTVLCKPTSAASSA